MSTFRAVFLGFLVAAIVLVIGDVRRVNSATSVPNTTEITYTIPPNTASAPITFAATNSPITFNLAVIGGATRGTSTTVVAYSTAAPSTLAWTSRGPVSGGTGAVVSGGSTTTANGATIVPLNSNGDVVLRVSSAVNKVEVFNASANTANVVLELNY